jgi:hypothetical protein
MTKDEKFEILDMIEEVLTRCEESIYKPESETYHSVVNPEKARQAIRAMKDSLNLGGEL